MRVVFAPLAFILLLTGCSGLKKSIDNINRSNSASGDLQSYIQNELATKFHRPAKSVSCTPYVDEVIQDSSANVSCVVRFADGSSYSTAATITDRRTWTRSLTTATASPTRPHSTSRRRRCPAQS